MSDELKKEHFHIIQRTGVFNNRSNVVQFAIILHFATNFSSHIILALAMFAVSLFENLKLNVSV